MIRRREFVAGISAVAWPLAAQAQQSALPVVGFFAARAAERALAAFHAGLAASGYVAYGPTIADEFHRAATYVDRCLRGARPTELPVQLPVKFEMVVNLKTAKALGLTVPSSFLLRADEVIE
jgi:putative tryptophan/tyrosine transport system substrate-binding protein